MKVCLPLGAFVLALSGFAQPVFVYSEFASVGSDGEVKSPARPREILSPAVARNGFTSFQVVVQVPADKSWWMHIGQNPENAVIATVYRESGDKLERVELPVKGQGTQVFWMDLWAARSAPVERIKVEPQLNIDDDWVIYPMEVRVMDAIIPSNSFPEGSATSAELMRRYVCSEGAAPTSPPPAAGASIPKMRFRNGQQDLALASKASKEELRKLANCEAPLPSNPEAYYPIRDYLFRTR